MDAQLPLRVSLVFVLLATGCADFQSGLTFGKKEPDPQPTTALPQNDFGAIAKDEVATKPDAGGNDVLAWISGLPVRDEPSPYQDTNRWADNIDTAAQGERQQRAPRQDAYYGEPEYDRRPYGAAEPAYSRRTGSDPAYGEREVDFRSRAFETDDFRGDARLAGDRNVRTEFNFDEPAASAQPTARPPQVRQQPQPTQAARPVVNGVVVRPGAGTALQPPQTNVAGATARVPGNLNQVLGRLANEAEDSTFRDQLLRRVLSALAGDDVSARQPLQLQPGERQELVTSLIELLIQLRDIPPGDLSETEGAAQASIERLVQTLQSTRGIQVPKFVLCNRVTSFGQYEPLSSQSFAAGRTVEFVAYTEARDWVSDQLADGSWHSRFNMKIEVIDSSGKVVHVKQDSNLEDITQTRRRDLFIAPLVRIERGLSVGQYVVKVTLRDTIGDRVAQNRVEIRVTSRS